MKMLSTGEPSTLGNWLRLTEATFGKDSAPAKFLQAKIKDSQNGENEEVIADERQLLYVLGNMFLREQEGA